MVVERLNELQRRFRGNGESSISPWGLPTVEHFRRITKRYGCRFPPSYVQYCTAFAGRLPLPDNSFKWASAGDEDAYASLETAVGDARGFGAPEYYVPFWGDEGNFYCFDTRGDSEDGEFPVVFWEHDAPSDEEEHLFPTFVDWLASRLEMLPDRRV